MPKLNPWLLCYVKCFAGVHVPFPFCALSLLRVSAGCLYKIWQDKIQHPVRCSCCLHLTRALGHLDLALGQPSALVCFGKCLAHNQLKVTRVTKLIKTYLLRHCCSTSGLTKRVGPTKATRWICIWSVISATVCFRHRSHYAGTSRKAIYAGRFGHERSDVRPIQGRWYTSFLLSSLKCADTCVTRQWPA